MGWSNAARGYNHVVVIAHSPYSLDNLAFIVRNDLNPFQFNAQLKTVFGYGIRAAQRQNWPKWAELVSIVLELRTSSPITRQPAVLIERSDSIFIVCNCRNGYWKGRRWTRIRVSRCSIKFGPRQPGVGQSSRSRHQTPQFEKRQRQSGQGKSERYYYLCANKCYYS